MRKYQSVSVPYKYDSLAKKVDMQHAKARLNMSAKGHQLRMKLGAETSLLNQQQYARNAAKMAEESGSGALAFEQTLFDGCPTCPATARHRLADGTKLRR